MAHAEVPVARAGNPPRRPRLTVRDAAAAVLLILSLALGGVAVIGIKPRPLPAPTPTAPAVLRPATVPQSPAPPKPQPNAAATPAAAPTMGLLAEPRPYLAPPLAEPDAAPVESPQELYERVVDRIACLTWTFPDAESQSSGFVLDAEGHILTAAPATPPTGIFVTLLGLGTRPARLIAESATTGLALVRVGGIGDRAPLALSRRADGEAPRSGVCVSCSPRVGFVMKPLAAAGADGHEAASPPTWGAVPEYARGAPVVDPQGRVAGVIVATRGADGTPGARVVNAPSAIDWLAVRSLDVPAFGLRAEDYVRFGTRQEDAGLATRAFRTALTLEPGMLAATYNLGVAARNGAGTAATAVAAFRQTTRLDSDFADAYVNWALLSVDTGDLAGAARLLENVTVLRPDDAEGWSSLAEIYRRLGRPQAAEQAARRAVAVDAQWPAGYFNLGVVYAGPLSDPEQARAAFETFARLAPDSPHAAPARAYAAAPAPPAG